MELRSSKEDANIRVMAVTARELVRIGYAVYYKEPMSSEDVTRHSAEVELLLRRFASVRRLKIEGRLSLIVHHPLLGPSTADPWDHMSSVGLKGFAAPTRPWWLCSLLVRVWDELDQHQSLSRLLMRALSAARVV